MIDRNEVIVLYKRFLSLWQKYKDLLLYLIFGVLTTAVNYIIYYPCYNFLNLSAAVSNVIAWCGAVAFAFLTNKPIVFQSKSWSLSVLLPELGKFLTCRIGSGLMETGLLFLTVDLLRWNGNWMKLLLNVLVMVINYVGSKLFVFKKRNCS